MRSADEMRSSSMRIGSGNTEPQHQLSFASAISCVFIIEKIFVAHLPRFESVTAQSRRKCIHHRDGRDRRRGAETWKMTSVKLIWLSDLNYRFRGRITRRCRTRRFALRPVGIPFEEPNIENQLHHHHRDHHHHHQRHQRDDHVSDAVLVVKSKSKALTRNARWAAINIYKTGHPSVTDSFQEYFIMLPARYEYIGFIAHRVFTFLFNIASCIRPSRFDAGRPSNRSIRSPAKPAQWFRLVASYNFQRFWICHVFLSLDHWN